MMIFRHGAKQVPHYFCVFLLFGLFFLLQSCGGDEPDFDIPDVSHIEPQFELIDFNKQLFALDTSSTDVLITQLNQLAEQHPTFTNLYFSALVPLKQEQETFRDKGELIRSFLTNDGIRKLNDTVQIVFPNLQDYKDEFEAAFQQYEYYFPNKKAPNVYAMISEYGYQQAIFVDSAGDALIAGLDFYLSDQYPYQQYVPQNTAFSAYRTRFFKPDYFVKGTLDALVNDHIAPPAGRKLIDAMINEGKKLYLMRRLLPYAQDSVILQVPGIQAEWCRAFEKDLYNFFVDSEMMYSTDAREYNKYIIESPNAPNMPDGIGGKTANYLGWRIIESYMKYNPAVTLESMLREQDASKIFRQSRYKPKR